MLGMLAGGFAPLPTPAPPPQLPAAVPPYQADPGEAARRLGEAYLYIGQLAALLEQRAAEANTLHDDLTAARQRLAELDEENRALAAAVETATARLAAPPVVEAEWVDAADAARQLAAELAAATDPPVEG